MFKVVDLEKGTVCNRTLDVAERAIKNIEAEGRHAIVADEHGNVVYPVPENMRRAVLEMEGRLETATELAESLAAAQAETAEAKVERIAKACHEANRAYCASMGDRSQAPWDLAPDWQRQSAIAGVQAVIDDPWVTPQQLHAAWMAQKEADGWVYGEVKDPDAKTHPCMVPFEELPAEQQAKDRIFSAIVLAMAA